MRSLPPSRARRVSGFGLLEIILVIALVIVAGAITFAMFESARPSSQVSSEVSKISTLATNLKAAYGINHDYSGLTLAGAIQSLQVPQDMVASPTTAKSLWGAVDLAPTTVSGVANHGFLITLHSVPPEACLKLVQGAAPLFPDGVGVNGVDMLKPDHTVDTAAAVAACSPADNSPLDVGFIGR